MKFATSFASLIDITPETPAPGEIFINGDTHACFAIWYIPALQKGYLKLAKNAVRDARLNYLKRLDQIVESTYIDELKVAGKALDELKVKYKALLQRQQKDDSSLPADLLLAQEHFDLLESLVRKDLNDFSKIISTITLEVPFSVFDLGDSTGDRGNCDAYMFESCMYLTGLGVQFVSIFSNHTLETMYAILTNQWDINTPPAFLRRDHAFQIRSLTNFRTLLKYGIISNERKNQLISHWVKHIKPLAYSYNEEGEARTSIYTHAPIGLDNIITLALNYCDFYDINEVHDELVKLDNDSIEYHEAIRALINRINQHFIESFFTLSTAFTIESLINTMRTRGNVHQKYLHNIYSLCIFSMAEKGLTEKDCPDSFTLYHGHRQHSALYHKVSSAPYNLICLDSRYFKPIDPQPITFRFPERRYLPSKKFNSLYATNMKDGVLYFTDNKGIYLFKGKSKQIIYNGKHKCLQSPHHFYTTIESKRSTNFMRLFINLPLNLHPTCTVKRPLYAEYLNAATECNVPFIAKSADTYVAETFNPGDINIDNLFRTEDSEAVEADTTICQINR